MQRVVIVGQGYVGLPVAIRACEAHFDVVGFDVAVDRVERLLAGESYVEAPSYLSWRVRQSLGHTFRFVELANDVNEHMPDYVVKRVVASLNRRSLAVRDRRILLLGLSYKKNTGDSREAPSQAIAEQLLAMGARVRAVDPHTDPDQVLDGLELAEPTTEEVAAADLTVLIVDHDAFDLELIGASGAEVLDCRNVLSGPTVETL